MIEPSEVSLIEQIEREGKPWGLCHMISSYGEVLVAELVPCKINLGNGITIVEDVKRDITRMSTSYPFSSILKNRFKAKDRAKWMGVELRHLHEKQAQEQKMEPVYHEMKSDLRDLKRGKLVFGVK